ncbi:MAG: alpha/beta fold hydrolase [Pseudomonadota bacterium]
MTISLNMLIHEPEGAATAPPLVVAHGLFGSARNFFSLGRKLATNRKIVLVDMRNHGESGWDDDVTYSAMADDLAMVIHTACDGRAVVMGHSMGGKAAMALALAHPDLVAAMIVADIAPVPYTHTHLPIVEAMLAADLSGVSRRSDGDAVMAAAIPDPMLRAFILQNLVIEDGSARWRLNAAALAAGMPHLLDWPREFDNLTFQGSVRAIYGGASTHMSASNEADMRRHFPSVTMEGIPDAGHWLHAEKPAEFLAAVQAFLSEI